MPGARRILSEQITEIDPDILLADGFDEAFIGIGTRCGQDTIAVYSRSKCIKKLMRDGMSEEEASEYFDFNVSGAWVGDRTPLFVESLDE
jgi:hypothetical protein